ncbi:MAG: nickel pincer cofactor biosynthesis protein LarB [Acidobacteriota bacterium]|nr:nickel pincer cofactor biosynthesis protein LarB [Acidobacteriota bacterium]MDH3784660.1 nickel pincer cofactor biosynthesis protein LarB [Acidobacteriota bacterium]
MEQETTRSILAALRRGELSIDDAEQRLAAPATRDLGFANVDLDRAARCGFPEVVYGPGKTIDQIVDIAQALIDAGQLALVTRLTAERYELLRDRLPRAVYHETARALVVGSPSQEKTTESTGGVVVVCAGTSDLPVAEEAALTAELFGCLVQRIADVGVAGLHRLLAHTARLRSATVIVAVAGMEGALPSVVAGMTANPVIAVPTSVGYGTGAGGQVALMAMLNSCAAGLTVVNIDNGFGAGYAAGMIDRLARQAS